MGYYVVERLVGAEIYEQTDKLRRISVTMFRGIRSSGVCNGCRHLLSFQFWLNIGNQVSNNSSTEGVGVVWNKNVGHCIPICSENNYGA